MGSSRSDFSDFIQSKHFKKFVSQEVTDITFSYQLLFSDTPEERNEFLMKKLNVRYGWSAPILLLLLERKKIR
jgi:hypothetical protein